MRQRVDCGYQANNLHTGRVMTTTNIGSCNCCGNCGCSNCLWRWVFDEPTMAYKWTIIDGCGGGSGSTEPCCGCPSPPRMGEYEEEEYPIACVGISNNKCACTTCTGWWDAFLLEWVPNTGCKNTLTNIFYPVCVCDLSVLTDVGTVHGEISRNVACTCSP